MKRGVWLAAALAMVVHASASAQSAEGDLKSLLQRQTQEVLDAITSGSRDVWDRYLDPRVSYVTEDGALKTRQQMIDNIRPLPRTISGDIRIVHFRATSHGDVAVATHLDDEHETFHGHRLHCQYLTTDTWKRTASGWRIIGSQEMALRTDPPAVALAPSVLDEYVGRYALSPDLSYEIRRQGNLLLDQETGHKTDTLRAEAKDVLFVPGWTRYRRIFRRDAAGRVVDFAERREAWDLVWKRSN